MGIRWKLFLILFGLTAGAGAVVLLVAERQMRLWVVREVENTVSRQVRGLLESRNTRLRRLETVSEELAARALPAAELRGETTMRERTDFLKEVATLLLVDADGREHAGRPPPRRGADRPGGHPARSGPDERMPRFAAAPASMARLLPAFGVMALDGEVTHFGRPIALRSRERRGRAAERLRELERRPSQHIAYLIVDDEANSRGAIQEVVLTPVRDDAGIMLGWFFIGVDAETRVERAFQQAERATGREVRTGLVVDDTWFVSGVAPDLAGEIEAALPAGFWDGERPAQVRVGGTPYLVIAQAMNPGALVGVGYHVSVFSLQPLLDAVGRLRIMAAGIGGSLVLVAGLTALVLSSRITRPIDALVAGTERVRTGDLDTEVSVRSKDEFGALGRAFNAMTRDLALKERYREVLGKVSDPSVARQLMEGELQLGGDLCEAAVLFCDIRGFTPTTEGMDPARVIDLLNRHMTAMTRIVHQHGGVVDKFVGDMVMAVFGVPRAGTDDAEKAAACALEMMAERRRLDEAAGPPLPIGIGIAHGEVVAGCMGSQDRLNFTVLGDRVNLASRLCSAARPGEVLVDAAVAAAVREAHQVEERPPVELRGFSQAVPVFALRDLPENV